jgi:flagellin
MATIRTNQPAGASSIDRTRDDLDRTTRRLSSGLKLSRAGEDAAGLAISEKLRAIVGSANQGIRNAGDGLSALSIADGGLGEISDAVIRTRELATQAGSGVLSADDQKAIALEVNQLNKEIGAIAGRTKFNGVSLLNQAGGTMTFQVGGDAGQTMSVPLSNFSIGPGTALASFSATVNALDSAAGTSGYSSAAQGLLAAADAALGYISAARGGLASSERQLSATISAQQVSVNNQSAAEGRLNDADFGAEASQRIKSQLLLQAGIGSLVQTNRLSQEKASKLLA